MTNLNKEQRVALHRKWQQDNQGMSYRQFRRTVQPCIGMNCVMVQWSGMYLGIELNGYTHS
jgi:hypothetical protein